MSAPFSFTLPPELAANEPPERRGLARDQVRLLVIDRARGEIKHTRFDRFAEFLRPGDLLVFNSSRTLPASLSGCVERGPCIEIRLAEHLPDDSWLALLVCQRGDPFSCGLRPNSHIDLGEGLTAIINKRDERIPRLWKLSFSKSGSELINAFYRLGRPVRYEYVSAPWGLDYYQTVYAKEPGSAEMPSAGRAFTWKLLFDLKRRGIETAYIVLHTSLSSYLDDELDAQHPASEEEYFVGQRAAEKINSAHASGSRVIAVGTTVVSETVCVADVSQLALNLRPIRRQASITPTGSRDAFDLLCFLQHAACFVGTAIQIAAVADIRFQIAYSVAKIVDLFVNSIFTL